MPEIDDLIRLCRALAMLDAILSPEWEYRYYSFNSRWAPGEMMASMNDGSGNEYFILFDQNGAAIKGFDHESPMSPWETDSIWPGMYDQVPAKFTSFLNEPAFSMDNVTFCIWREYGDSEWRCGVTDFPGDNDPDGSGWMLKILDGDPATYQEYVRDYFEIELPLDAIDHIYRNQPLADVIVQALNSEITVASLEADAIEIGYPVVPLS